MLIKLAIVKLCRFLHQGTWRTALYSTWPMQMKLAEVFGEPKSISSRRLAGGGKLNLRPGHNIVLLHNSILTRFVNPFRPAQAYGLEGTPLRPG